MQKTLLLALFTLLLKPIFAQEEVLVDTAYRRFNTLVVTSMPSKNPERKLFVPQEIKALSNDIIKNINAHSTADLVQNTGTAYVQKSFQGGGNIILRGFGGNRNAMYLDGVRLNNLLYSANAVNNIVLVDQNLLENIEIMHGAGSTVYGSDALGGVIHLRTRIPELASDTLGSKTFGGNIFAKYNTVNNGQNYHADVNYGDGRTAFLTSVSYSTFGDLKMGKAKNPLYKGATEGRNFYVETINGKDSAVNNADNTIQKQSAYNQINVVQKILFQPEENVQHRINLQYSGTSEMPNYANLTEMNYAKPKYAQSIIGPQKLFLAAYDLNLTPDSTFFDDIHVGVNLQDFSDATKHRLFNNKTSFEFKDHAQVIGASVDFRKFKDAHTLRYGFDAQYNSSVSSIASGSVLDSSIVNRYVPKPPGGSSMLMAALYATHTFKISDMLILNDGIRIGYSNLAAKITDSSTSSYYHKTFDIKQASPVYSLQAGLNYLPIKKLKLNTLISTGYRVPNIFDLSQIYRSRAGRAILPNNNLKAEKNVGFDLGATYWFNENVWIENTFYATYLFDAVSIDKVNYNGNDSISYFYFDGAKFDSLSNIKKVNSEVFMMQNSQTAVILGVSTKVNVSFAKYWQIMGSFNYTQSSSKKPVVANFGSTPPIFANLSVKFSKARHTATFYANYNSLKPLSKYGANSVDNNIYAQAVGAPSWFTLNLNWQYRASDKFLLQAGVDNILDTQYRTFGSGISAPGRNIFACLRFTW